MASLSCQTLLGAKALKLPAPPSHPVCQIRKRASLQRKTTVVFASKDLELSELTALGPLDGRYGPKVRRTPFQCLLRLADLHCWNNSL